MNEISCRNNILNLINQCIPQIAQSILIIYDKSTTDIAAFFARELKTVGKNVALSEIEVAVCHGVEPDDHTATLMLKCDVILCITKHSLAHTQARREAESRGIPFLSMPGYNNLLLSDNSMKVNYGCIEPQVRKYANLMIQTSIIRIITDKGSDIVLYVKGRSGNCCPGMVNEEYSLGSPPDIEANIAPIEEHTEGTLVIDGSITDERIGLLRDPVTLHISDGRIKSFESTNEDLTTLLTSIFKAVGDDKAYYVGEFGIGFNDKAKLCGNMLIDEGTKGCVHFGMGSNWTIGGKNRVPFHLDFVLRDATVFFDNVEVIRNGDLLYD